jgi:cytochrome c oxidase subunit 2
MMLLAGVGVVVFIVLALCALYVLKDLWSAKSQIDEWSKVKHRGREPRTAELPIEIVGRQFEWRIRYPSSRRFQSDPQLVANFAKETSADQGQADDLHLVNELHLWEGAEVQILLKSKDVLHSLFVPVFRLKQDAVPGKVTTVWLVAHQSNVTWDAEAADWKHGDEWEFACAEHHGLARTKMRGQLFVHETKDDFLRWLKRTEEAGLQPPRGQ